MLLVTHVSSHQSLSSPSPITVTSTNISSVGTHIHSSAAVSTVSQQSYRIDCFYY